MNDKLKSLEDPEKNYDALKLEELKEKHKELNIKLREKSTAALDKDESGKTVTEKEQAEIDNLANQQESTYNKLTDKVRKNYGC